MKETLERLLPKLNLSLTSAQLDTLARFGSLLLEKNQVMNLTAITEPQKVAELHFYDCLALLNAADFRAKRVVDIGCGAGFPGVPLKIAEPSMALTLLDSLGKRMDWLREVLPELQVEANVVTARAEEYVTVCRESYDIAVSRAVARLNILSELCLPYVKVGGCFVACMNTRWKTPSTARSSSARKPPRRPDIPAPLPKSKRRPYKKWNRPSELTSDERFLSLSGGKRAPIDITF